MEWIDVKDRKPETDQLCYVFDSEWHLTCFKAIYHKDYDRFVQDDPSLREHPSLSVTHWCPLPVPFLTK